MGDLFSLFNFSLFFVIYCGTWISFHTCTSHLWDMRPFGIIESTLVTSVMSLTSDFYSDEFNIRDVIVLWLLLVSLDWPVSFIALQWKGVDVVVNVSWLDTAVWMNSRSNWWRSCSWVVVAHLRWMGLSLMHQYLGALVGCRWYWYRLIADTEWGQRQVVGAATMQPSAHWHSAGWWKWLGRKCNDWRFRRCPPTSIFL